MPSPVSGNGSLAQGTGGSTSTPTSHRSGSSSSYLKSLSCGSCTRKITGIFSLIGNRINDLFSFLWGQFLWLIGKDSKVERLYSSNQAQRFYDGVLNGHGIAAKFRSLNHLFQVEKERGYGDKELDKKQREAFHQFIELLTEGQKTAFKKAYRDRSSFRDGDITTHVMNLPILKRKKVMQSLFHHFCLGDEAAYLVAKIVEVDLAPLSRLLSLSRLLERARQRDKIGVRKPLFSQADSECDIKVTDICADIEGFLARDFVTNLLIETIPDRWPNQVDLSKANKNLSIREAFKKKSGETDLPRLERLIEICRFALAKTVAHLSEKKRAEVSSSEEWDINYSLVWRQVVRDMRGDDTRVVWSSTLALPSRVAHESNLNGLLKTAFPALNQG